MHRFSFRLYGLGVVTAGIFLTLSMLILTMVLYFSAVSESILPRLGAILQFIAVFAGGLVAAKKAKSKGVIYGAAVSGTVVAGMMLCRLASGGLRPFCEGYDIILIMAGIFGAMVGIGLSEQ